MYASSSDLRCQFTSTTGEWSLLAAAHVSKNSRPFGSMIATRSPAPIPRAAQRVGEARGAVVEIGVGAHDVAEEQRRFVGRRASVVADPAEVHESVTLPAPCAGLSEPALRGDGRRVATDLYVPDGAPPESPRRYTS